MNAKELQTTNVVTVITTDPTDPSTSSEFADLEADVKETNYTPIKWIDGGGEPLSADNIQRFEDSFTALIGNSSVAPEGGIIDKITATLGDEITNRVKDIKTIHTRLSKSEENIQEAVETESNARIDADATLNGRINKFDTLITLATRPSQEAKLKVIKSITIDPTPDNDNDSYVKVTTGEIDLAEVDIPTLHTDKINLNDDSKSLTSKIQDLDDSDTTINARIDNFQLKNPDVYNPQDDDHTVTVNIHDVVCDENKLPINETGAYVNGTSVISKIYIDPQRSSEGPYVVIEKAPIDLIPVDIPMLPPNWIFGYRDMSDYNAPEHKNYTLDVRLDVIEDRITSLTTDQISVNDPATSEDGYCEVISSFQIEDDKVKIETAPIALTNKDIPANISSDKIDITVSGDDPDVTNTQTLTEELAKLNAELEDLRNKDIDIKTYIDAELLKVTKGTMYWQTY